MMTVFWYYRPEDTEGTNLGDFQQVCLHCYIIIIKVLAAVCLSVCPSRMRFTSVLLLLRSMTTNEQLPRGLCHFVHGLLVRVLGTPCGVRR